MTEYEFRNLKIGTVVKGRFDQEIYYEIYDYEEFDPYYMGRTINEGNKKQIRISNSNYNWWEIVGTTGL